ncbi:MAG: hypothetical protein RMM98_18180 [Acidobacteriota bacterium]|nr:hypothetical protein [Acidobacteriota bacterium]
MSSTQNPKDDIWHRQQRLALGNGVLAMRPQNREAENLPCQQWPSHVWIVGRLLAEGYKPADIAVLLQVRLSVVKSWQRQWQRMRKQIGEPPSDLNRSCWKEKISWG